MPRTRNIDKYDSTLRNIHNKRQEAVEKYYNLKKCPGYIPGFCTSITSRWWRTLTAAALSITNLLDLRQSKSHVKVYLHNITYICTYWGIVW
jgi:hypothetical protein